MIEDRRLLLVTGARWLSASRYALAARQAGFEVSLLGPRAHPVARLDWVDVVGEFSAFRLPATLARILNETPFALLVPTDDLGFAIVVDAYRQGMLNDRAAHTVERSLGAPSSFGIRHSRIELGGLAARTGLVAPVTIGLDGGNLDEALDATGLPAVLKVDGGAGGQQVMIVQDADQAAAAYRVLARRPSIVNAVGRLVLDHDETYLAPAIARSAPVVSVQQFAPGEPANLAVASWQGEVLGQVGARAVRSQPGNGPATIIEPFEHPDMTRAASVVARELGLSGLFGLDFVLAPDRSSAALIELNPRATPTSPLLPPSVSRPLWHLLADAVGVDAPPPPPPLPAGPIALFPQLTEIHRDDAAAAAAHLDLPAAQDVVELCRNGSFREAPGVLERTIRRIF